ncbi:MAG: fructose-6-phosphate aldolase, partial [Atopostipes sp.]|nr:fructose-6-phosphate aldolase [Atopostipes sp.]
MQLILDTANIEKIEDYLRYLPVHGVTTNPSILSKEKNLNPIKQLNKIRELIGKDRSLHVQVVATDFGGIMKDAHKIIDSIDEEIYIKIPVTKEGLKAMKVLKEEGMNITATTVYSKVQAFLAMDLEVDYIAPYVNRMKNLELNPNDLIQSLSNQIEKNNRSTKILGASFKNSRQVIRSIELGAHFVTVSTEIIDHFTENYHTEKAVS